MSGENFAQVTLNRATTTHDRFMVLCSVCGWISGHKNFSLALSAAQYAYMLKHTLPDEKITIYDLMAHKGKPELWDFNGNILTRKGQSDGKSD